MPGARLIANKKVRGRADLYTQSSNWLVSLCARRASFPLGPQFQSLHGAWALFQIPTRMELGILTKSKENVPLAEVRVSAGTRADLGKGGISWETWTGLSQGLPETVGKSGRETLPLTLRTQEALRAGVSAGAETPAPALLSPSTAVLSSAHQSSRVQHCAAAPSAKCLGSSGKSAWPGKWNTGGVKPHHVAPVHAWDWYARSNLTRSGWGRLLA